MNNHKSAVNDIDISEPGINDFPAILPLLEQLWSDKELHRDTLELVYKESLSDKQMLYRAAWREGKIVGFITLSIKKSLWQEGNLATIEELIVHEDFRGSGIGGMLVKLIAQEAIKRGCTRLEVDSALHRDKAHRFYQKQGFKERARLFTKSISE